jgi:hypothetical protein
MYRYIGILVLKVEVENQRSETRKGSKRNVRRRRGVVLKPEYWNADVNLRRSLANCKLNITEEPKVLLKICKIGPDRSAALALEYCHRR